MLNWTKDPVKYKFYVTHPLICQHTYKFMMYNSGEGIGHTGRGWIRRPQLGFDRTSGVRRASLRGPRHTPDSHDPWWYSPPGHRWLQVIVLHCRAHLCCREFRALNSRRGTVVMVRRGISWYFHPFVPTMPKARKESSGTNMYNMDRHV